MDLTWYCWTVPVTQIINLDSWIDVTTLALHKCQIPLQWNMAGNRWRPFHFHPLYKISGSDFVYITCQPTCPIHEVQPLMILKVGCATKPWYWLKWDNQAIWYFPNMTSNMTSNPVQTNSCKEPVDAGIQTVWSSILNYELILITFNFSSTCHVQAISYQQLVDGDWVPCWLPSIPTPACQCYCSIRSPEFLLPTNMTGCYWYDCRTPSSLCKKWYLKTELSWRGSPLIAPRSWCGSIACPAHNRGQSRGCIRAVAASQEGEELRGLDLSRCKCGGR
jgi:hypothetical protein